MNRRGFISLLAGAAGAPLVPWRGLIAPVIVLPTVPRIENYVYQTYGLGFTIPQDFVELLDEEYLAIGRLYAEELAKSFAQSWDEGRALVIAEAFA